MANEIKVLSFEEVLAEYNAKLIEYNSLIQNRQTGGAYDLQVRIDSLMLADAYAVLLTSMDQIFVQSATGEWLDLHAQNVNLQRLEASKTQKEFILRRDTDGGVVQIPVGDVLKTPVLPTRGQLRFFSVFTGYVDLTGNADATGASLIDNSQDFVQDGVEVGTYIFNQTDSSYGIIKEVNQTELVVDLAGGTLNSWTAGDAYKTQKPSSVSGEFTTRSKTATAGDPTGAVLTDTTVDFTVDPTIQLGQKIFNVDDGSVGTITVITANTVSAQLTGGTNNTWTIGDDYKLQTDLEIIIISEAEDGGTDFNSMELLLGRDGQEVAMEIESGFTGVDSVTSTGDDLVAGTNDEEDPELRQRIYGQWNALARGATKSAYEQFAINSSPTIFDANAYKGTQDTDVKIVLSGVAGSRDVTSQIGIKVNTTDNFDSLYTDDGLIGGVPRPLGIAVHEYIRSRCPLTDIIFLSSVTEQAQNIDVDITVLDGFDFETEVKPNLLTRLRALFLPERTVKDVEIMKVGEDLLFSKLTKIINSTAGIADFAFNTPDAGVNDGNTTITDEKVFTLGTITIGKI